MTSRRSYLDTLNTGRQRRPSPALDELTRTLEALENQLERPSPFAEHRREMPEPRIQRPVQTPPPAPSAKLQSLARDMERTRRETTEVSNVGQIASELHALREDMRQQMASALSREFDTLRGEVKRIAREADHGIGSDSLFGEVERLNGAIADLSRRSDDKNVALLRLELDQVKSAVGSLAREDTLREVGNRWDAFDRRMAQFEERVSANRDRHEDPQLSALTRRLEQIATAVDVLPESLSLRTLEDKVRTLAGALDHFARKQDAQSEQTFEMIGERLDEISRAIAASVSQAQPAAFDPEPFQRIEARMASLAHQIEELTDDRPVIGQITALSARVDELAARSALPEKAVARLSTQLGQIVDRLEKEPASPDVGAIFDGIERRFAVLSDALDRRQSDSIEQGNILLRDLEKRLDTIVERLDVHAEERPDASQIMAVVDERFASFAARLDERVAYGPEAATIRELELRLGDIASRLDTSARQVSSIDEAIIGRLEAQVAEMSARLSRPAQVLPELDNLAPRFDQIERSIASQHEQLIEAARSAAADAVRDLADRNGDPQAVAGLSGDLRSLEMLTRRSDERNSKTFEAIHDTLIKIVDRLSVMELHVGEGEHDIEVPTSITARAPKPVVADAPSIADDEALFDRDALDDLDAPLSPDPVVDIAPRTPTAKAAEAAAAAMKDEQPADEKRSMLGGLTKAFRGRKDKPVEDEAPASTALRDEPDFPSLDQPLDPQIANQPLEPGSGAPDLNAIMKRVRDERGPVNRKDDIDAAKSDFIAAARRAAQAAAAEAVIKKRGSDGDEAGRGKLGKILGIRRKTVLMATVALVVGIGGMQLGRAFLSGDTPRIAGVDLPGVNAMPRPMMAAAPATVEDDVAAEEDAMPQDDADLAMADETPADVGELAPQPPAVAGAPAMQATAQSIPAVAPAGPDVAIAPSPTPVEQKVASLALTPVPANVGPIALREAAEGGDAKALFEIGTRFAEGRNGEVDMKSAADWYQRAADLGYAPAQYRVGNFYEKGLGVERDIAKAKAAYEKSAGQGNASAMHNLAVLYAMGADGATDNVQAVRWFTQAAEHGVRDSQFNLGILAAKGVGMNQDLAASYKWFALVAKSGDKDAEAKRDEIGAAMKPEELAKAKADTDLWRARTATPAANDVDVPAEWREGGETTASVDMKQAVINIQRILNKNGYDAGNPDGVMGGKTKNAIIAFQSANGMTADGEISEPLVRALLAKK